MNTKADEEPTEDIQTLQEKLEKNLLYQKRIQKKMESLLVLNREVHILSEKQLCDRALDIAVELTRRTKSARRDRKITPAGGATRPAVQNGLHGRNAFRDCAPVEATLEQHFPVNFFCNKNVKLPSNWQRVADFAA